MSDSTMPIAGSTRQAHFRPHWVRVAIVCTVVFATVGLIAFEMPVALWIVVPFLGLVCTLAAFLNSGLILSNEGIEWYAIHPRWRFRKVPWDAVLDVRRGLVRIGNPIRLTVESGRYERWVWGAPQAGRKLDFEIWPNSLTNGEFIWEAIQQYRSLEGKLVSNNHV